MNEGIKNIVSRIGGTIFRNKKDQIPREKIRSVLVISLYFRGDSLLITPALKMLKRFLPNADVHVWVKSRSAELLKNNPHVDEVIVFDHLRTADYEEVSGFSPGNKLSFLRNLRGRDYDLCIDLTGKYSTALISLTGGFNHTSGLNYNGFGFCYDTFTGVDTQHTAGHLAEKYCLVVRETLSLTDEEWRDFAAEGFVPVYVTDEAAVERVRQEIESAGLGNSKPLIAIQPFAGWSAKEWSMANYSELVASLSDRYDAVLIGSDSERIKLNILLRDSSLTGQAVVHAGPIGESAAVISMADCFLGSDSVGLQLAGALNIPSVALFGPTNPGFSNPQGPLHETVYFRLECSAGDNEQYCTKDAGKSCTTWNCMKMITPAAVAGKIDELIAGRLAGTR